MLDVIIVGGGAAGFFAAIHITENNVEAKVLILERGKEVLGKVKVSGGGRCNVTHAEFDPKELSTYYPRGEKELMGPFHVFSSGDTMGFFEENGVPLKIESDGRIFPESNSSQSIIDCFMAKTSHENIQLLKNSPVVSIDKIDAGWEITTSHKSYKAKKILLASGASPKMWKLIEELGHTIVPPVPSLFTFNCKDDRIQGLQGISAKAEVEVLPKMKFGRIQGKRTKLISDGPLLITHWGFSGPAILKLSAWGARILNNYDYQFQIKINWMPDYHADGVLELLLQAKQAESKKTVLRTQVLDMPNRLWSSLLQHTGISKLRWAEVSKAQLQTLAKEITEGIYHIQGKSTFKEEFVTAGGVDLKEIDFKSFRSKIHSDLFFAGEVLNIDAITGGFNFQNAWTGAYIAAKAIASESAK